MLELRIDLDLFRPPVWRRVRLHAATTLTELHEIVQVLFDWDGDHMHVFTVDGVHYAHRASRNRRPGAAPNRPTCTGGRGDAPVEDWPDEEPPPRRPLDLIELDRCFAHHVGRS